MFAIWAVSSVHGLPWGNIYTDQLSHYQQNANHRSPHTHCRYQAAQRVLLLSLVSLATLQTAHSHLLLPFLLLEASLSSSSLLRSSSLSALLRDEEEAADLPARGKKASKEKQSAI